MPTERQGASHRITATRKQDPTGHDTGQQAHSSGKKVNRTTTPRYSSLSDPDPRYKHMSPRDRQEY